MGDTERKKMSILPPGFEQLSQVIYGELNIIIKKINYLNVLNVEEGNVRVRFQFYGESGQSHLLIPQNSNRDLLRYFKTSYKYLIACSIWKFKSYLLDMNILKLFLVDHNNNVLGFSDIQFEPFLDSQITEQSTSVFKNLRGNFAIISQKNGNQKIGSIEIEITNDFDTEISQFVLRAESKYQQEEFNVQVEDYVMKMILQKQGQLSNSQLLSQTQYNNYHHQNNDPNYNQNNNYLQSSQENTRQLTIQPETLEMARQRIPATLVQNNSSYNPQKYSQDKFYQVQQENEQLIKQKQDQYIHLKQDLEQQKQLEKQIIQNKLQQEQIKQQQQQQERKTKQSNSNNNKTNKNQKINSNTQQQQQNQQNISNQQMSNQKSKQQFNQNTDNSNQQDITNLNDNAFIESSQEQSASMQRFQENNSSIINAKVGEKLDKIVNIGEQMFNYYLESNKQQQMFNQQIMNDYQQRAQQEEFKIQEENQKRILQQEKLQIKTQKLQLLEKQYQQVLKQQEEKIKKKEKENLEFIQRTTAKQQQQTLQATKINRQTFPINQQIFDKTQIRFIIYDFTCSDSNFCQKISQKNIYLETLLPKGLSNPQLQNNDPNQLKTVCKNIVENKFIFNTDTNQQIAILPENIDELLNQQIEFQIKAFSIPKNTIEIDKGNDLVHLLAKSSLNFREYITKSKNFTGLFHIEMKTKFLSEAKIETQKSQQNKHLVIKKENLKPVEMNEDQVVGILKIGIQLQTENKEPNQTIYQQHQSKRNLTTLNNNNQNTLSPSPLLIKPPSVSFQMLLRISKLNLYSNLNQKLGKKIYAQFKVYGTQETIQTKEAEIKSDSYLDLDTEIIIPCSREIIIKMKKVPLTIEVWQKDIQEQKQEVLGIVNMNLSSISTSVLNKNNHYNDNWSNPTTNSSMMIVLSNQFQDFCTIASKKPSGQIFTTLIFGSVSQVKQFKDMQQQNTINPNYTINKTNNVNQLVQNKNESLINRNQQTFNNKVNDNNIDNEIKELRNNLAQNNNNNQDINLQNEYPKQEYNLLQEIQTDLKSKGKVIQNYKDKIKDEFKRFEIKPEDMKPISGELIMIEIFESLRSNEQKVKNRLREFLNNLRPPNYFVKTYELFNFLRNIGIKWKNEQDLIDLLRILDYKNNNYIESEIFSKSQSAYVYVEEQIRNALNNQLIIFKTILISNAITITELSNALNRHSQFSFANVQQLTDAFASLQLAGLDSNLISNIISFLPKENDDENILINVGEFIDYFRQIEVYSKLRHLQTPDQQLFRDQIIRNLKKEIERKRINIGTISEERTQNLIEIDVEKLREILQQAGIELSYWESYCILNEIAHQTGQVTKDIHNLKLTVLQFNSYFLELERTIIDSINQNNNQENNAQRKQFQNIQDNESDIQDLNAYLNKSLLKQNNKNEQIDKNPNSQEEQKEQNNNNNEDQEQMISYQLKISCISLTDIKVNENLDSSLVYMRYSLPLQEESWIDSSIFELYSNKDKYLKIGLNGSSRIDLRNEDNFMNVFKQSSILLQIRHLNLNSTIATATLDINYIFELFSNNDNNNKNNNGSSNQFTMTSLSLIDEEDNKIGNANLKIQFQKIPQLTKQQHQQILQQQEQQIQKLIPKQGYLMLNVLLKDMDEDCQIQLSIFKDDSFLNHLFKPIVNQNKIENQHYFITISTEILRYFEQCQGLVQILDSKGEIILSEYEFNLVNILVTQQIYEQVALQNSVTKKQFDMELKINYTKNI